jgi:hypothetical protein
MKQKNNTVASFQMAYTDDKIVDLFKAYEIKKKPEPLANEDEYIYSEEFKKDMKYIKKALKLGKKIDDSRTQSTGNDIKYIRKVKIKGQIFCKSESDVCYKTEMQNMKMEVASQLKRIKRKIIFLLISVGIILVSLVGIILFLRTSFYIIHPSLYVLTFIMGMGWGITALYSFKYEDNTYAK